jgi:hypothetical protein
MSAVQIAGCSGAGKSAVAAVWMRAWFTTTRPISGTLASTCAASCPVLQDRLRASGAIPVDARQPLDQVVDALLSRMLPVPLAGQADSPGPGARGR